MKNKAFGFTVNKLNIIVNNKNWKGNKIYLKFHNFNYL